MDVISVKKDIYFAKRLIDLSFILSDSRYTKYCRIPFLGTENSKELFAKLNTSFEKSFMVTGSGDQLFEAILHGAQEIKTFDINKLAGYGCALKVAAIKALDYEEFMDFYFYSNMSLKYYELMRIYLNSEELYFWDELFNYKRGLIIKENLFDASFHDGGNKFYQNYSIYEKECYNKIKDRINSISITFLNFNLIDVRKQPCSKNEYDFIYLSTIYYYLKKNINSYAKFIKKDIMPMLKDDGEAIIHYFYGLAGTTLDDEFEYTTLKLDFKILYELKNKLNLKDESIEWSGYGNATFDKDCALILKKDCRRK